MTSSTREALVARLREVNSELREALVEARKIVFSDAQACKAFRGPDELSEPERVLEVIDRALSLQ